MTTCTWYWDMDTWYQQQDETLQPSWGTNEVNSNQFRELFIRYSSDKGWELSYIVYTDYKDRTGNMVKNTQIQVVIRLQEWRLLGVFSTSFSDLLVVIGNGDIKESKVVRYSSFTEIQSIPFNGEWEALYSSCKDIIENRNVDICVRQWTSCSLDVQSGLATPVYYQCSSLYYQLIISSNWHHNRQLKSDIVCTTGNNRLLSVFTRYL